MGASRTPQPALIDSFGRKVEYVRLSVADKCKLRCFHCPPEGLRGFETPAHWLRFEEIGRVNSACAGLGVRRVSSWRRRRHTPIRVMHNRIQELRT